MMSARLFTLLPRMKWKMVQRITPDHAAALTSGNTDKFMNKDFWLLELSPPLDNLESRIPVGAQAVYYHDTQWWLVEKVKN